MPQFFVQGDTIGVVTIAGSHVDLSAGAGTQVGIPPVAPPVPVVVEPPVPVVVEPPVPVVVVEPPVPVVVVEPPVPLPPVPSLTVSPLVQPYPMRPSATIALNPATINEVRFI